MAGRGTPDEDNALAHLGQTEGGCVIGGGRHSGRRRGWRSPGATGAAGWAGAGGATGAAGAGSGWTTTGVSPLRSLDTTMGPAGAGAGPADRRSQRIPAAPTPTPRSTRKRAAAATPRIRPRRPGAGAGWRTIRAAGAGSEDAPAHRRPATIGFGKRRLRRGPGRSAGTSDNEPCGRAAVRAQGRRRGSRDSEGATAWGVAPGRGGSRRMRYYPTLRDAVKDVPAKSPSAPAYGGAFAGTLWTVSDHSPIMARMARNHERWLRGTIRLSAVDEEQGKG